MLKYLFQIPECCLSGEKGRNNDSLKTIEEEVKKLHKLIGDQSSPDSKFFRLLSKLLYDEPRASKNAYELYDLHVKNPNLIVQYIAQICNFIIHGKDCISKRELTKLTLQISSESLYIAHLFYWYFNGCYNYYNQDKTKSLKISYLMHDIKDVGSRSLAQQKKINELLIDSQLLSAIGHNNSMDKLSEELEENEVNEKNEKKSYSQLWPAYEEKENFLNTPNLIDTLGKIGYELRFIKDRGERNIELKRRLTNINERLPSQVYLPIFNRQSDEHNTDSFNTISNEEVFREHSMLRIPLSEAFCLHSNEWAPYHICVEVLDHERSQPIQLKKKKDILENDNEIKIVTQPDTIFNIDMSPKSLKKGFNQPAICKNTNDSTESNYSAIQSAEIFITPQVRSSQSPIAFDQKLNSPSKYSNDSNPEKRLKKLVKQQINLQTINEKSRTNSISNFCENNTTYSSDEEENDYLKLEEKLWQNLQKSGNIPKGIFGDISWDDIKQKVRSTSPYGHLPGWRLISTIIKASPDLRQEQFAAQLLYWFDRVFRQGRKTKKIWIKPFHVLVTTDNSGLVETIPDAIAIDSIKKLGYSSVWEFFKKKFPSNLLRKAQENFVYSMVGYSLICYILNIRDRHNANILLDSRGHVIHVDFGFMFHNSPGGVNLEPPLFKLTSELVEVMEGENSDLFTKFKEKFIDGFMEIKKLSAELVNLVRFMLLGEENLSLPCFRNETPERILSALKERLCDHLSDDETRKFASQLVHMSSDNWRTTLYDHYQRWVVGVL